MKIIFLTLVLLSFLHSNEIQTSKNYKKIVKNQENLLKSKLNLEKNTFPDLMMKKRYKTKSFQVDKIVKFKAKPFQLNVDSNVYNSINGKKIYKWKKGRTFTSNKKTKTWIQVTGYFVNKKWQKSKKDMWVKIAQVSKK